MEETRGSKVSGIRQMGRLKELLQKWQSVTLSPKGSSSSSSSSSSNQFLLCNENNNNDDNNGNKDDNNNNNSNNIHGGISPAICRRLIRSTSSYSESDDDGCGSPDPPFDVPRGYLAVYVGPELRRFIIPTSYLSHQVFKVLLEKVEEEFGFDHSGGLTIPCEIETFKFLLKYMETHQNDQPEDTTDGSTSLTVEE